MSKAEKAVAKARERSHVQEPIRMPRETYPRRAIYVPAEPEPQRYVPSDVRRRIPPAKLGKAHRAVVADIREPIPPAVLSKARRVAAAEPSPVTPKRVRFPALEQAQQNETPEKHKLEVTYEELIKSIARNTEVSTASAISVAESPSVEEASKRRFTAVEQAGSLGNRVIELRRTVQALKPFDSPEQHATRVEDANKISADAANNKKMVEELANRSFREKIASTPQAKETVSAARATPEEPAVSPPTPSAAAPATPATPGLFSRVRSAFTPTAGNAAAPTRTPAVTEAAKQPSMFELENASDDGSDNGDDKSDVASIESAEETTPAEPAEIEHEISEEEKGKSPKAPATPAAVASATPAPVTPGPATTSIFGLTPSPTVIVPKSAPAPLVLPSTPAPPPARRPSFPASGHGISGGTPPALFPSFPSGAGHAGHPSFSYAMAIRSGGNLLEMLLGMAAGFGIGFGVGLAFDEEIVTFFAQNRSLFILSATFVGLGFGMSVASVLNISDMLLQNVV